MTVPLCYFCLSPLLPGEIARMANGETGWVVHANREECGDHDPLCTRCGNPHPPAVHCGEVR